MKRIGCAALLLVALAVLRAGPARASDGSIEINAAKAGAGGVTSFDGPGFPVTLSAPGSYRLTGDLLVGDPGTGAISITSADVTVDLGGFTVSGCPSLPCPAGAGSGIISSRDGSVVRNGRINGMGAEGIVLQSRARVEDVDVAGNGGTGITVLQGSVRRVSATGNAGVGVSLGGGLLEDSELRGNAGLGASLGNGASYARNVFSANATSVSGGHATGGNVCSDNLCSVSGARRFYLGGTPGVNGANAQSGCVTGFHMASMWEVHEPSALFYDRSRGETLPDAGQGPPSLVGWIRTGNFTDAQPSFGRGNCSAWTSSSNADYGGIAFLAPDWNGAQTSTIPPWTGYPVPCDSEFLVWCVED